MTVVCGKYEWDEDKNAANVEKHGVGARCWECDFYRISPENRSTG